MIPNAREAVAADATRVPAAAAVVTLPAAWFMSGCAIAAVVIVLAGHFVDIPVWLLTVEVLATILGLFAFGSFRFQIHKNALTFGLLFVIAATFSQLSTSTWHAEIARSGWQSWARHHVWSFAGLDDLIHADTMLFILGLTLFVSVISQTRLLEVLSFRLLRRYRGAVFPTLIAITLVVSIASGVLDGVSMIGLTIRTLVIIMLLAATPLPSVRYAVMLCTNVTTICGVWLAYGEPPESDHEGESASSPWQRLLPAVLRAGGRGELSGDRCGAPREVWAPSGSIWKPSISSTRTPRTCAFSRPHGTARS